MKVPIQSPVIPFLSIALPSATGMNKKKKKAWRKKNREEEKKKKDVQKKGLKRGVPKHALAK
jgi:hypothetical protein